VDVESANPQQAEEFWVAMAALKRLTAIELTVQEMIVQERHDSAFMEHFSRMTQLR